MKLFRILLTLIAILLAQTMILRRIEWLRMVDLFLLFNVYFALNFNQFSCMAVSIPSGLLQDAFSKGIIGMNAFSKTIVVYLISGLSSRLMLKHPLIVMILIVFSTNLDFLIVRGLHGLFGLPGFPVSLKMLLAASILNSMIGIVGYYITDRLRMKKEYA